MMNHRIPQKAHQTDDQELLRYSAGYPCGLTPSKFHSLNKAGNNIKAQNRLQPNIK